MLPSNRIISIRTSPQQLNGGAGFRCCWCTCCTCMNLYFLKTRPGVFKLLEIFLGSFCETMALNFGSNYSGNLGASYYGFLASGSWCVMTTFLLLLCYVLSERSYILIKQSLFELMFNVVAAFSYISSCSYLGLCVNAVLYPMYLVTPFFQVYPAMTGAYIIGTIVGLLHGYDAYTSYLNYKGYR